MSFPWFADFLFTAIVAGLLGMAAMGLTMWLICRAGWARGNMIVAIGGMITRERERAWRTGALAHTVSALGFACLYEYAMLSLGLSRLPRALGAGAGFGVVHGLIVSLTLVWECAEHHPLPEFREAGFAVGLSHFAGHVAYGAAVGLVIGLFAPH
jgi:hypothetical protein